MEKGEEGTQGEKRRRDGGGGEERETEQENERRPESNITNGKSRFPSLPL